MKKILLSSTIAISLAAFGASMVQAQGGQRGGPRLPSFEVIDGNANGALTMEEFQNQAQAKFDESDANGDGQLDADEITAIAEQERAQMIDRMMAKKDTNGDGVLSLEEMQPGNAGQFFARADTDGNGEISRAEWDAARPRGRN